VAATLLGIDTGGTFTDFVFFESGRLRIYKLLSTPSSPVTAILQGVRELAVGREALRAVHGSTVATNAVLEGKGVPTLYVTNRGLGDVLTIARQARRALYDLQPPATDPPVPAEFCLEVGGRLDAQGRTIEPVTAEDLKRLKETLARLRPRAVAVNLLFSWLDDSWERRLEKAVPSGVFVSRSSQVMPEYREYERGITTWLNAWVGPIMQSYLARLQDELEPARVSVMQSSGGTVEARNAGARAVNLLLSGPAGGLMGARFVAGCAGRRRLLSLDMGGTSTDVAMIDGELTLTTEGRVGGYPVGVPQVDMHTIGAGGGSIAYLDSGGMLQVGPQSAGAEPGPACYGRGGTQPTVTDANLVLGRLRADAFLGGRMRLDPEAARRALEALGRQMDMSVEDAAQGVIAVANEHMVHALRVISVQRGTDPRGFTLVSFGGAGGLHVCALADALGMREGLVPVHAGVLSALGMLVAPPERRLARTVNVLVTEASPDDLAAVFEELAAAGCEALINEAVEPGGLTVVRSVDLRYRGQSSTLELPWGLPSGLGEAFAGAHRQRYGHDLDVPIEIVNCRVMVRGRAPGLDLARIGPKVDPDQGRYAEGRIHGVDSPAPIYRREALGEGQIIAGPALVTETVATTYVAAGWTCHVDLHASLLLCKED
jgi:N-methylhydantoinase A